MLNLWPYIYLSAYQVEAEKSSMSLNFLLLHFVYSVGVHVCRDTYHDLWVKARGQLTRTGGFFLPHGSWEWNFDFQISWQILPALGFIFSSIFICAYMFLGVQATCTCGCQQNPERPLALLKLDLRAIMSQLTWALGDGTGRPLGEQEALLTSETSPQPRAIPASVMISAHRFSRDSVHVFSTASA